MFQSDAKVLGLQVWEENRTLQRKQGGNVLDVPHRNVFSLCGKFVGHFPVCDWLKWATGFIKCRVNEVSNSCSPIPLWRWWCKRHLPELSGVIRWKESDAQPARSWINGSTQASLLLECWRITEQWLKMHAGYVQKTTPSTSIWAGSMREWRVSTLPFNGQLKCTIWKLTPCTLIIGSKTVWVEGKGANKGGSRIDG